MSSRKHQRQVFHMHLISDATGETLNTVARAAAAYYADYQAVEHIYALVRSPKQLDRVIEEVETPARHRALHPGRPGAARPSRKPLQHARHPLPVDLAPVISKPCRLSRTPSRGPILAASMSSMPSISGESMPSTTRCCMMMASIRKISTKPKSFSSASAARRRLRPASISPIAASAPPTSRWYPASRPRASF